MVIVYTTLTYVSGVFYYLSTTVNPLLYNIMSNKFREAFKVSSLGERDLIALFFTDSHLNRFIISNVHILARNRKINFIWQLKIFYHI